jgi:hypothetical protein
MVIKKNRGRNIIIVALLIIGLIWMFQPQQSSDGLDLLIKKAPKGSSLSPSAINPQDVAVKPHFADANKVEVLSVAPQTFSLITYNSNTYPDIFFMYLDVSADLIGVRDTTVSVTDVNAYDADGASINKQVLLQGWSCILNDAKVLTQASPSVTWSPYDCGGAASWVPTTIFETEDVNGDTIIQPITFEYTLTGSYVDTLGRTQSNTKTVSLILDIQSDSGVVGGFNPSLIFADSGTLEECDATIPEVRDCYGSNILGSSCQGTTQTCTSSGQQGQGLWPGCGFSGYETNALSLGTVYTGSAEFQSANWKALCTDTWDNDCDGLADRNGCLNCGGQAGINMNLDPDCPYCQVKFRTSALPMDTLNDDVINNYVGEWVVVDVNGDDNFGASENFGYVTTGQVHAFSNCGGSYVDTGARTSQKAHFVCSNPLDPNEVRINFDVGGGNYQFALFRNDDGDRCSGSEYPACLTIGPTSPWSLTKREQCVNY